MRASPHPRGHLGKTLLRNQDMRIVLLILDRGARIPDHSADEPLTIHAVDGRAIVGLLGSSFDLSSGQLLAVERGVSHSVVAIEDTALLLTIAGPRPR